MATSVPPSSSGIKREPSSSSNSLTRQRRNEPFRISSNSGDCFLFRQDCICIFLQERVKLPSLVVAVKVYALLRVKNSPAVAMIAQKFQHCDLKIDHAQARGIHRTTLFPVVLLAKSLLPSLDFQRHCPGAAQADRKICRPPIAQIDRCPVGGRSFLQQIEPAFDLSRILDIDG